MDLIDNTAKRVYNLTMSTYTPDVWVIVEIKGSQVETTYHRILAGWYGGFARGDSWKMSSGITRIVEHDTYWEIHNSSGSIYDCHKNNERHSGYTRGIYESYAKDNNDKIGLTQVSLESIREQYR